LFGLSSVLRLAKGQKEGVEEEGCQKEGHEKAVRM
jgi:hypothetical protein